MTSMMGKPLSICFKRNKKRVTLLMLGLDNAGKSSAIKNFLKEENEGVVPTVGFSMTELKHKNFVVTVYDLGGGKNIRGIWKNYYALVHGVIFVVDSSDQQRLQEGKEVIESVIKDRRISGKPILLLVNKQDIDGALNEVELCSSLNLEEMVNEYRCPTRIENSTALVGTGSKIVRDSGIEMGFKWILDYIDDNFVELSLKVGKEMNEQKLQEEIEKKERLERVMKLREERERLQQENGNKTANEKEFDGNPFRPMREIKESFVLKDSALRKCSVGANGKEEITTTEAVVHMELHEKDKENFAEESYLDNNIVKNRLEETITDGLQSNSAGSPLKDKRKKFKRKPFKNKIDPMKVPLYSENALLEEIVPVQGSSYSKPAWDEIFGSNASTENNKTPEHKPST